MIPENKSPSVKEILFMPIGCMLQMPIIPLFLILGTVVFVSFFAYNTLNYDPLHIWSRQFPDLVVTENTERMNDSNGNYWEITYEREALSTYSGLVRHASPDNENLVPMMTHDILVTTEDYANPEIVNVQVVNHHFSWQSQVTAYPRGTIDLIHAVPANKEIFDLLRQIKKGDQVTIIGKEIYKIDAFNSDGILKGFWSDSGCKTLFITDIQLNNP